MTKNTTGGKHKGRKNGEGNTARKNRTMVEAFISDIRSEGKCEQIYVGRVIQRVGDGRMTVFYTHEGKPYTIIAPIKGSLRGRGKSQARIEVGSVVMVSETGLGGSHAYEIVAVMTDAQVDLLRSEMDLDPRILAKDVNDADALKKGINTDGGFEFEYEQEKPEEEEELDIEAI